MIAIKWSEMKDKADESMQRYSSYWRNLFMIEIYKIIWSRTGVAQWDFQNSFRV